MTPQRAVRQSGSLVFTTIAALTVTAAVLRFWKLGAWSFDSDETFTLRDSLHLRWSNPRPLFYFLNHYVILPFHPLDELGLRLLPAFFGALAIPVFFVIARRLIGDRGALFGALLLTFSPLHVYYSQFGRYWSFVFLVSAVYPFLLYFGIRDRRRGALAAGIGFGVIATLAHPSSMLLVGGVGAWLGLTYLRGNDVRQLWRRRAVWQGLAAAAILAVVVVVRFIPMLETWVANHEGGENTEFLLHLPGRPGVKQLVFLASYAESLTIPLTLLGVVGLYLLWRGRDRSLALFLVCVFLVPFAFLLPVSLVAPVSTFYLVPPIPVLFIGAGYLLDRLTDVAWELQPQWLLSGMLAAITIAAGAPTLVSQYRDGRRYDFRSVAHWLHEQRGPSDVIVSDQPKVLEFYMADRDIEYLRGDPEPLAEAVRALPHDGRSALWVVSPAPAHAFRTNPQLGSLQGWLYVNCQLRNTIGVGRVDFRQYHLQVFRCGSPAPADSPPVSAR